MDDVRRRRARMVAEARHAFRFHIVIYVVVNVALVLVWYFSGVGFPWPLFPIFFWGLGVIFHYMGAYHSPGTGWVDRETDKILKEEDEAGKT